jgi:hypothetical protein
MPGGGATPRGVPSAGAAHDGAERQTAHDDKEPDSLWHSKTLAAMLAFGGCNSIMLIVNKMAIRLLPVPSLVLVSQLVVSAHFCQAGNAIGVLDNDAFEWGKIRAFFPAVCGFLAALFCNAKARGTQALRRAVGVCTRLCPRLPQVLEHANVETFIVVRASSPLLVAVSDWHFMGRELPDGRSSAVLFIIFFSALAYVQKATLTVGAVAWSSAWLVVFVRQLALARCDEC